MKICIFDDATNLIKPVEVSSLGGISPTLLKTNGVANPVQSTLNLIAGANITLTPDGAGGVTIESTASGIGGSTNNILITPIDLAPTDPGNFTVPHGLLTVPQAVGIEMTSGGEIWFQTPPYDATNLYLTASDSNITATASCFTDFNAPSGITQIPSTSGAINVDWSRPSLASRISLTGDATVAFSNAYPGKDVNLLVAQDSVGGHAVTWDTNILNSPTILTAASSVTALKFIYDGSNYVPYNSGGNSSTGPVVLLMNPSPVTVGDPDTSVTVTGRNFTQDAVVNFGSTALSTTYVSATRLTATIPADLMLVAAVVPITITSSLGTSDPVPFTVQATSSLPQVLIGAPIIETVADDAAAPVASLTAGTYTTVQSTTLSSTTPGATIYYTTDGTTPTPASTVYSGPIKLLKQITVKAMTAADHYNNSSVTTLDYNIDPTLSTRGGDIVDVLGNVVRLNSINWFGAESGKMVQGMWWNARPLKTLATVPVVDGTTYTQAQCEGLVEQIIRLGFNCVRIPICEDITWPGNKTDPATLIDPNLNPQLFTTLANPPSASTFAQMKTSIEIMDAVVEHCCELGLYIIFDMHTLAHNTSNQQGTMGKWYTTALPTDAGATAGVQGEVRNEQQFLDAWEFIADRYKDSPFVVGCDILNEPHACTWDRDPLTGVVGIYEKAAVKIHAKNPKLLIVCEGIAGNAMFPFGEPRVDTTLVQAVTLVGGTSTLCSVYPASMTNITTVGQAIDLGTLGHPDREGVTVVALFSDHFTAWCQHPHPIGSVVEHGGTPWGTLWGGNLTGVGGKWQAASDQGPGYDQYGQPLAGPATQPAIPIANKLVYSPHEYGTVGAGLSGWWSQPDFPDNMEVVYDTMWGYIKRLDIAPLWIGELGTDFTLMANPTSPDSKWWTGITNYINNHGINFAIWAFPPNGTPPGLLTAGGPGNWITPIAIELEKLQALITSH